MAKQSGRSASVEVARISVKVSPDTKEFRRELSADLKEIERTLKGDVEVKAHLESAQARADFERMMGILKTKGAKGVKIRTDIGVDDSSSEKNIRDVERVIKKQSKMQKLLSHMMPSFGSGINPAGYALAFAGVLAIAAPLVSIISAALLALPGLIGLIATPIAAITLGLDGFARAAEKIKGPFEELKKLMSDTAETAFTPVMQRIADEIFPRLKNTLPGVTTGLASLANGILDAFNQPDNIWNFQRGIDRIGASLNDMKPGAEGFTSGFVRLFEQFSRETPGIAAWFNKTGKSFDEWITKASADGSLHNAFTSLGDVLRTVGDLLVDLGKKGIEWLKDPHAIDGFKSALKELADIINGIMDMSKKLLEHWQGVVQAGRPLSALFSALRGDFKGAGGTLKDFFTNKDWQADDAQVQADKLTEAIKRGDAAAQDAKRSVTELFTMPDEKQNPMDVFQQTLGEAGKPAIPPPDTAPAKEELANYQSFVDGVTAQVKESLQQASSSEAVPPPNLDSFKAAWSELPNTVRTKGDEVQSAAAEIPGKIGTALEGTYASGKVAGNQVARGLVDGMAEGIPWVTAAAADMAKKAEESAKNALEVRSPSRVFTEIGNFTAQGFGIGMKEGFQPVLSQARDLANQVSAAFASGGDPSALLNGMSKQEVNRIEKTLALETKRLESQAKALDYQSKLTGDASLKARAAELRQQKEQLSLQKEMLDLAGDYNDEIGGGSSGGDPLSKALSGMMSAPVDFAKATGQQFLSDIGISGNGIISKALTEGIQYIFNVGSMDDALSAKDREQQKNAVTAFGARA